MASSTSERAVSDKPTAIVIGAGPAGLSVSLGLAHRGWKVILVEKYESFEVRGASFGMGRNGIKALEEIHPGTVQHEMIDSGRGIPLPSGTLVIPWWMMRDALLERVRKMVAANVVDLKMGLSIEDILDEGDSRNGVTARFTNGETIEGDVLIGADGVHSSVRRILGLSPTKYTGTKIFRGTVLVNVDGNDECVEGTENLSSESSRLQHLVHKGITPLYATYPGMVFFVINFHSQTPGRMCWVCATTDKNFDTETTDVRTFVKDNEKDEEKLASILAIFDESSEDSLQSYTEIRVADFSDDALNHLDGRWGGKKNVTLIGDAAHAMRATDGQGGNMAFEDAIVLCRLLGSEELCSSILDESSSGASAIEDILGKFERTRMPRVKKVHDSQRLRAEARLRGERMVGLDPEFKEWIENGV
eukprot:CAMPEP_0172369520 /NCGR_PEP_ID=MMETSP1060-20121228/33233_1 /TAXON_ID=37318 /ORGANISM="Pseudo-nitzschia pungens, Strain cf. cingulata" /LENGTH=417 /DNA_ID=CAMNT_0013094467 /DNA_START=99 /DNA_END=1352 /DNA_ORIENTATION=-